MVFFGLDIGSSTTKIVQLKKEAGKYSLISAGMAKTPSPGLSSEAEKDLLAVAESIKKLRTEAGVQPFEVVCSLPERSVFTRVIDLPAMNEEEVGQALQWELEEIVPIPLTEANYDWQVIRKLPTQISVLVAVAPKTLIKKYLRIFELADLKPLCFETEVLAIFRALKSMGPTKTKLIIDFGAKAINLVVGKGEEIILNRSLPTAGEAITRAVASGLSLENEVAEEYKKTYGLMADQFEGKIRDSIQPVMKLLIAEVGKSIDYCKTEKKEEIEMIVLSGGSASLPQFRETLMKEVGIEIVTANPFLNINLGQKLTSLSKFAPAFSVAVGLAMREE